MTDIEINGTKIRRNIIFLTDNTKNFDDLTMNLFMQRVIDNIDGKTIYDLLTPAQRTAEFYSLFINIVTDRVFAKLLENLHLTDNSLLADMLESEVVDVDDIPTSTARCQPEILPEIEDIHMDTCRYVVQGFKDDYFPLRDFKYDSPEFVTQIKFTFVSLTCKQIVEGLQKCRGLRSLLLEEVSISGNEYLHPDKNDSGHLRRVYLPELKEFVWRYGEGMNVEPKESFINSWIFFYKTEEQKSWVIKDIGLLEMRRFKLNYSHTSQCFLEIYRIDRTFRYGLEDNVDSMITNLVFPIVKLELWKCRVSVDTLPIFTTLRELTLKDVLFEDRISFEMNNDWFENCEELISLHVSSVQEAPIVVDLFSAPPNLERLKLVHVGVKAYPWYTADDLTELIMCDVWFVDDDGDEILPSAKNAIRNPMLKLKTLNIQPHHSDHVAVNLNCLRNRLTKLRLHRTRIPKPWYTCYFHFSEYLVELDLHNVVVSLGRKEMKMVQLGWLSQFRNLEKLKICSKSDQEIIIRLNTLSSRLTHLILHDIRFLLPIEDRTANPLEAIRFGENLQELEFINCSFIVRNSPHIPGVPGMVIELFMEDFKEWMLRRCSHAELQLDSHGWLRYRSTPIVEEIQEEACMA